MSPPPFEALRVDEGGRGRGVKPPVDINVMKRNMTVAKGFLDISLLTANANQLRNVMVYGDSDSITHQLIMTGIILSLIMQVAAGVALIVAERFDINKEEEQGRGDLMNTVVTALIFVVLIINVFVASLGVDVVNPNEPHHPPGHYPGKGPFPSKDLFTT